MIRLTQSFLIAGANGLSVSLWQVSDESTMKFMVGLYLLVTEYGVSYDRAMTLMKRTFLRGSMSTGSGADDRGIIVSGMKEEFGSDDFAGLSIESNVPNGSTPPDRTGGYTHPYYWAPFVYYGK